MSLQLLIICGSANVKRVTTSEKRDPKDTYRGQQRTYNDKLKMTTTAHYHDGEETRRRRSTTMKKHAARRVSTASLTFLICFCSQWCGIFAGAVSFKFKITGHTCTFICLYIYFCLATKKHDDKEERGTTSKHSIPDFFLIAFLFTMMWKFCWRGACHFRAPSSAFLFIFV